MSIKKMLAAAAASVVAVSAMAVVASADYEGKMTVDYVEKWTDIKIVNDEDVAGSVTNNLGGVDLTTVESITITSHGVTDWIPAYDSVDGWTQDDTKKYGDGDSFTFENINLAKENLCIKAGVNAADDASYFDIVVKTAGAAADAGADAGTDAATDTDTATDTGAATDTDAAADANSNTGVEGVAAVLGVAAVAAGAMIVAKKRK